MKKILFVLFILPAISFSQEVDSTLQGKWILFEIIDNMTGNMIKPSHKANPEHEYYIEFRQNEVNFNLEINKCSNELVKAIDKSLEFKYYNECTEICCDEDFSNLLTYADCTKYYIKKGITLIMVSEDRIFYFSKAEN